MNNKAIRMWALIGVVTGNTLAIWAVIELIGSYTIIGLFIAWMLVTAGVIVGSIGDR